MEIIICDNCRFQISDELEFCPECGVPVLNMENSSEYFICTVCENKNPKGARKCAFCCSIL